MLDALLIIVFLLGGYFIDIRLVKNAHINRILEFGVISIIVAMGYKFGAMIPQLHDMLGAMMGVTLLFIIATMLFNMIGIKCYFSWTTHHRSTLNLTSSLPNKYHYLLKSTAYLLYLMAGVALGYVIGIEVKPLGHILFVVLLGILFFIGMQMRREKLSFTKILKNKAGIAIALIVIITSLLAGLLVAHISHISYKSGLMLTAGFGWYSLSSVINTTLLGPSYGIMSFFIDFSREIVAIIFIPMLRSVVQHEMVGYAGATSMDFTLPVIKSNYGIDMVPTAICSGFILTLLTPLLLPLINILL